MSRRWAEEATRALLEEALRLQEIIQLLSRLARGYIPYGTRSEEYAPHH